MKIGVIAPPWLPVPPIDYGGTELVIDLLCRGYAEAGHNVVLYCSGNSTCPVERRSVAGPGRMPPDKFQEHLHFGYAFNDIKSQKFDLVHAHLEGILPYSHLIGPPLVCTVHVPVTEQRIPLLNNSAATIVAISSDHASTFPTAVRYIHNGLELERYQSDAIPSDHLIWIGAISPEKGIERSLQLAVSTNNRLVLAGMLKKEHQKWFQGLLDFAGDSAIYIGPVGFNDKLDLLTSAKALLMPVSWREPFGLIAVEAMACGTPVIATALGALPEIVTDGLNGFLCEDELEFAEAIEMTAKLDRIEIKRSVREKFSSEIMVGKYLELFEELIR